MTLTRRAVLTALNPLLVVVARALPAGTPQYGRGYTGGYR